MGLPPNATAAEKAKYNLCKRIARYERENKEIGKRVRNSRENGRIRVSSSN